MKKTAQLNDKIAAFSFMGLMASEGKIPGVTSGTTDKEFFLVKTEDLAREIVSDFAAEGDFFSLMTEAGMMRAGEASSRRKKPLQIKITRPRGLGGDFGDINFGGGALAH